MTSRIALATALLFAAIALPAAAAAAGITPTSQRANPPNEFAKDLGQVCRSHAEVIRRMYPRAHPASLCGCIAAEHERNLIPEHKTVMLALYRGQRGTRDEDVRDALTGYDSAVARSCADHRPFDRADLDVFTTAVVFGAEAAGLR